MSQSATFEWLAAWPLWCAALWWGSLSALGGWVVPTLFAQMPSKALAGNAAAALFGAQSMAALVLGAALLMASSRTDAANRYGAGARDARAFVLAAMVLALLLEFAVAPRISARVNLPLWHGLGSAMFLLQWLCAGAAFWKLARPAAAAQS